MATDKQVLEFLKKRLMMCFLKLKQWLQSKDTNIMEHSVILIFIPRAKSLVQKLTGILTTSINFHSVGV